MQPITMIQVAPDGSESAPVVTTDPMVIAESLVKRVGYHRVPDTTTTICVLVLQNGFVVIGKSACVDAAKFNAELGEKYAREDAMRQARYHVGFWMVLGPAKQVDA